jgi:microsomal dipeptidase-like Zn-dependent dipeptidase
MTDELINRGYSAEDINKIWGGNLLRVMREVAKVASKIQNEN